MKLTYIFHSGFVLETEHCIHVFDYWLDPSDVMEGVVQSNKPLYVFSSHFHKDHFNRKIFGWKEQKLNITYILSGGHTQAQEGKQGRSRCLVS